MSRGIDAGSAPRPVGAYPHARRVGNLLLLSGIGPRDPASNAVHGNEHDADGKLVAHDIAAQTRAVFPHVRAVRGASGARWEDLADVTVYLNDMAGDYRAYHGGCGAHLPDPGRAPSRQPHRHEPTP